MVQIKSRVIQKRVFKNTSKGQLRDTLTLENCKISDIIEVVRTPGEEVEGLLSLCHAAIHHLGVILKKLPHCRKEG